MRECIKESREVEELGEIRTAKLGETVVVRWSERWVAKSRDAGLVYI